MKNVRKILDTTDNHAMKHSAFGKADGNPPIFNGAFW